MSGRKRNTGKPRALFYKGGELPCDSAWDAPWKHYAIRDRVLTQGGPYGVLNRLTLVTLISYTDDTGHVTKTIEELASLTHIHQIKALQKALVTLAKDGWLQIDPETWPPQKATDPVRVAFFEVRNKSDA